MYQFLNKYKPVLICLLVLGSFSFFFNVKATDNNFSRTVDCDKRGSSGTCGYSASTGSYQAWSVGFTLHGDGHGAFGPSGGRIGLNFCINDDGVMWHGSCWRAIDGNDRAGNGNHYQCYSTQDCPGEIGDYSNDYQDANDTTFSIGNDYNPTYDNFVAEVYANDATVNGPVWARGRLRSIESFTGPGSAAPNTDFTLAWTTSYSGESRIDAVSGSSTPSSRTGLSGDSSATFSAPGNVTFRLTTCGPRGGTTAYCTSLDRAVPVSSLCGNGTINSGEECDGGSLNGATCSTLGYAHGTLTCTSSCTYNRNSCWRYKCDGGCVQTYGDGGSDQCTGTTDLSCGTRSIADIKCNGADSCTIASGASATISWTSQNVTACTVSPAVSGVSTGLSNTGRSTGALTSSTLYTLTCTGGTGATDSVMVTVTGSTSCTGRCFRTVDQIIDGTHFYRSNGTIQLTPGVHNASVTVQNIGTMSWDMCNIPSDPNNSGGTKLGSQSPQDLNPLIPARVCLPNIVLPGSTVTIPFTFTMPTTFNTMIDPWTGTVTGNYYFRWSLIRGENEPDACLYGWFHANWRCSTANDTGNDRYTPLITVLLQPVPPPLPTNLTAVCDASGTFVNLGWAAVVGADSYALRMDYIRNNTGVCTDGWWCSDPPDRILNYYVGTAYNNYPISPGAPYSWWIHSYNNASGLGSLGAFGSFNCPGPPPASDITCESSPGVFTNGPCSVSWNTGVRLRWCGATESLCSNSSNCFITRNTTTRPRQEITVYDGGLWRVADHNPIQGSTTLRAPIVWGLSTDIPVPGDYDGDDRTDVAVITNNTTVSPRGFQWSVDFNRDTNVDLNIRWGSASFGDIPVPGDYDGDGSDDFAVWRNSTGEWLIDSNKDGLSDPAFPSTQLGVSGDIPVPGDYNGDGRFDYAVWGPSTRVWYLDTNRNGTPDITTPAWGLSTDIPVPGDYDGDGWTDLSLISPSGSNLNWYIDTNRDGGSDLSLSYSGWWGAGYKAVPADYNGDGLVDPAVAVYISGNWRWMIDTNRDGTPDQFIDGNGDSFPESYIDTGFSSSTAKPLFGVFNNGGIGGTTTTFTSDPITESTTYTLACVGPGGVTRDSVTIDTPGVSLSAVLSATTPTSGNAPLNVSLQASAGGTASGPINYYLWWNCSYTGTDIAAAAAYPGCGSLPVIASGCAENANGAICVADDQNPHSFPHTYQAGTFRPMVIIGRSSRLAQAFLSTNIQVEPPLPALSNMEVLVVDALYCGGNVHAIIQGTYTDSSGQAMTEYEAAIDDNFLTTCPNSEANCPTNDPEWSASGATSVSSGGNVSLSVSSCNVESAANPDNIPQTNCQMDWNRTYYAWMRARNSGGTWSNWSRMSFYCNDGTCVPALSWTTPTRFPDASFSFSPTSPTAMQPITFTDQTIYYDSGTPSLLWTFTGGEPATVSSTIAGSTAITRFSDTVSYPVSLRVRTSVMPADDYCYAYSSITIQRPIPIWREIAPK